MGVWVVVSLVCACICGLYLVVQNMLLRIYKSCHVFVELFPSVCSKLKEIFMGESYIPRYRTARSCKCTRGNHWRQRFEERREFQIVGAAGRETWRGRFALLLDYPFNLGGTEPVKARPHVESIHVHTVLRFFFPCVVGATRAAVDAGYVPNELQVSSSSRSIRVA